MPVIKVLLDGGADADAGAANRTTTAMLAAGGNAPEPKVLEAVTLLVEHGVDVNAFNANGQTIVHNAATRGQNSVIEYVASKGAKLDRRDKQGRTPLDVALGVGTGGRRQGRPRPRPVVNEKTAALLRELMAKKRHEERRSLIVAAARCVAATSSLVAAAAEAEERRATACSPPTRRCAARSGYDGVCARCHGVPLHGQRRQRADAERPGVSRPLGQGHARQPLHEDPRHDAAAASPGTLTDEVKLQILAYVLQQNGFPAGTTELPGDVNALDEIGIQQRGVWDGIFTSAQADAGKQSAARCQGCHGPELAGTDRAPALKGTAFLANWEDGSVNRLFMKVRDTHAAGQHRLAAVRK